MLKPKAVGYIVIIYALAAHLWGSLLFYYGLLIPSAKILHQVSLNIFLEDILPGLLLLFYLVGGIGLIILRHWAVTIVFLTAAVELVALATGITMLGLFMIKNPSDITSGSRIFYMIVRLAGLVIPGVIAYMALRLHKHSDAWRLPPHIKKNRKKFSLSPKSTEDVDEQRSLGEKRPYRYIFWGIIMIGAILPWIVGIGVKLYLDAHGKPTLPWSYFVDFGSLIFLIPVSAWYAIPYIILAYFARNLLANPFWGLESYVARLLFIAGGLVGGCVGTVMTFIKVFWQFDFLYFLSPLWIYYIPHMVGGLFIGFLVARGVEKYVRSSKTL